MVVPPAALLYVFADELIERDAQGGRGERVPGTEVAVEQDALAAHVVAMTLWGLREFGLVRLRLERTRRFGVVRRTSVVASASAPLTGGVVEHLLSRQIQPGRDASVRDAVHRALGRDSSTPARDVVRLAAGAALDEGYLHAADVGRSAVGALVLGRTDLELAPAAVAAARGEWEAVLRAWRGFHRAEPELATELLRACRTAITDRTGPA